jgi:thiamine biosynthesis lipoprotein
MNAAPKPIKTLIYAAVCLLVLIILAVTLLHKKDESIVYRKLLMGTMVEVTIMDGGSRGADGLDSAVEAAYQEIKRLEQLFSSYLPLSDVSRISANAGKGPVVVSPEVAAVTAEAIRMAVLTHGAFDPTIGALGRVWSFSGEVKEVPAQDTVARLRALVDYRAVIVDTRASTVELKKPGMAFNLGGIAKGYIVGRAVEVLKAHGVERAIIKAGGDMFAFNATGAEATPFIIGIQDPRDPNRLLGETHFNEGAVATSGDYERFFIKDGVRYHHILDPATGYPAKKSRSVTIAARNPTLADALSTSVFVMGAVNGMELIESLEGVEGLIVDSEGGIFKSSGFEGRVF